MAWHEEKARRRTETWESMRKMTVPEPIQTHGTAIEPDTAIVDDGDARPRAEGYGWAAGQGVKVVEVLTPSWRSQQASVLLSPVCEYREQSLGMPLTKTKLNDLYSQLDAISASQSQARAAPKSTSAKPSAPASDALASSHSASTSTSTNIKLGHVAPSHHRFTLAPDLRRRGTLPKTLGNSTGRKRKEGEPAETDLSVGAGKEWMWATGKVGEWPSPAS